MQDQLIKELNQVRAELQNHGRTDSFYDSLAYSYAKYGSWTDRQEAALKRSLTTYHDRNERIVASRKPRTISSPIPVGRVTITGRIVSTKWVENDFGGSLKMLVESDQGWRVYGTVPARLGDLLRDVNTPAGVKVAFTANVQPKESDFGFFSRPTGGAVLADEHPQAEAPVTLPNNGWASHKKVPAPVVQEQRVAAAQAALEREVHFAPIQNDLSPEALLEAADLASGGLASEYAAKDARAEREHAREVLGLSPAPVPSQIVSTAAVKTTLTGLAALVAAAGYTA